MSSRKIRVTSPGPPSVSRHTLEAIGFHVRRPGLRLTLVRVDVEALTSLAVRSRYHCATKVFLEPEHHPLMLTALLTVPAEGCHFQVSLELRLEHCIQGLQRLPVLWLREDRQQGRLLPQQRRRAVQVLRPQGLHRRPG